jgi:hypothetical protein
MHREAHRRGLFQGRTMKKRTDSAHFYRARREAPDFCGQNLAPGTRRDPNAAKMSRPRAGAGILRQNRRAPRQARRFCAKNVGPHGRRTCFAPKTWRLAAGASHLWQNRGAVFHARPFDGAKEAPVAPGTVKIVLRTCRPRRGNDAPARTGARAVAGHNATPRRRAPAADCAIGRTRPMTTPTLHDGGTFRIRRPPPSTPECGVDGGNILWPIARET